MILQINPFWEQAINGALLLLAIGLDAFLAHAIGPRTAQAEELAPCLSVKHAALARWETVTVFLLLVSILYGATTSRGLPHRAAT